MKLKREVTIVSEQMLQLILHEIKGIKTDITELKQDVSELKQDISAIKSEQQITNDRLTRIESKQGLIYNQTGKLSEYHTETIARFDQLATKKELKESHDELLAKFTEGQLRQEKILERLSIRSVEQEADIAQLRQVR